MLQRAQELKLLGCNSVEELKPTRGQGGCGGKASLLKQRKERRCMKRKKRLNSSLFSVRTNSMNATDWVRPI